MTKYYKEVYKNGSLDTRNEIDQNEYLSLVHDIGLTAVGGEVGFMCDDSVTIKKDGIVYTHYIVDTVKRYRKVMAIYEESTEKIVCKIYSELFK